MQSKTIRLMNNPNLTNSLQSLSHRRFVADLSNFHRYFHGYCSQEIKNIIPDPVRRVRTTRSSTHPHPFQATLPNPRTPSQNHLSFLELLNCRTHCHPLLSPNPTICHLLHVTSTNLILSPYLLTLPLSLSFSFVGALLSALRPFPDLTYYKKNITDSLAVVVCFDSSDSSDNSETGPGLLQKRTTSPSN